MTEKKAPRPISEIQNEYQALASRAGFLQYQIYHFTRDLGLVNEQMRDLNFEAAEASRQASEAPKAETEEKKEVSSG